MLKSITHIPAVSTLLGILADRGIGVDGSAFRGAFGSQSEALQSISRRFGDRVGYDNEQAAGYYRERLDRIFPTDYPVLFWLRQVLELHPLERIFEVGGHVGVAYYSYPRYIAIPKETIWEINDVPSVCQEGRRLANERGATNLRFTSNLADGNGASLIFGSGSFQYLDRSVPEVLSSFDSQPASVLINMLPVTNDGSFFTIQNIGVSHCAYRVQSRKELLMGFDRLGYSLVDSWENPEKKCRILGRPDLSLDHYEGFFFRTRR